MWSREEFEAVWWDYATDAAKKEYEDSFKRVVSETFHQEQQKRMSWLGPTDAKENTRMPITEKDRTPLQWNSPLVEEPGMCKNDSEKLVEPTDISEHTGVPVCMHDEEIRGRDGWDKAKIGYPKINSMFPSCVDSLIFLPTRISQ